MQAGGEDNDHMQSAAPTVFVTTGLASIAAARECFLQRKIFDSSVDDDYFLIMPTVGVLTSFPAEAGKVTQVLSIFELLQDVHLDGGLLLVAV